MKKLIYISLLALFFSACSGDPIFYTLENEEEIIDSNNFKSTTPVNRIFVFNSAGQDYYITHGKQLWYSTAGSDQSPWNKIPLPDGYSSSAVVTSIAEYGGRLYATIFDEDSNSRSGLYYISDVVNGTLQQVFEYTRLDAPGDDYYFYTMELFTADTGLYISRVERLWNTHSSDSSSIVGTDLYYFSSAPAGPIETGSAVTLPGLTNGTYVVKSMTDTSTETNEIYLAINEVGSGIDYYASGRLYTAGTGTPTVFTEEIPGKDASYNHVYYAAGQDILMLSTRESGRNHSILYKLQSGGTWGAWQTGLEGPDDVQFSAFEDISSMPGAGDIILVGTKGDVIADNSTYYNGSGYYELNLNDRSSPVIQANTFALSTNYSSTDLSNGTIMDILYDSARDKVYITTSSYGMWLNQIDAGGDRLWKQE